LKSRKLDVDKEHKKLRN